MENQDNKNNKKDEIISRRKFFKRAAGMVIPAIALTVLPSALTSCEIDEPYPGDIPGGGSSGCSQCKGGCGGGCTSNCGVSCGSKCTGSCGGDCTVNCSSMCKYTCKTRSYNR